MEDNCLLLTICIPTYNRCEKLRLTLSAVFQSIGSFSDIEVVVSDNCSIDDTATVISDFLKYPQLRSYKNKENLGFNRNVFLLIQNYARGKYCWMIGDDDFIDKDAICHIRKYLLDDEVECFSLSHRMQTLSEYKKSSFNTRKVNCLQCSFAEAIEWNACTSNILGTFMSSWIFAREKVQSFDFSVFSNAWDNYYSIFPNAYLMVNSFGRSQCACITTPLLTALIHEKDWDDKGNIIFFSYLPLLYQDFRKRIGEDLPSNKEIIHQNICGKILSLMKQRKWKEIPIGLLIKSFFWNSTYKYLLHRMK